MELDVFYVEWADAHGSGGAWEPADNASAERLSVHAVGFLWDQNDTDISLIQNIASNRGDDDAFYNRINIPRGTILKMLKIDRIEFGEQHEQD